MSLLSDNIESFIIELLRECDFIELQRNELATYFNCAPSQINYVLATRFGIERGFSITSKRGGGGFIKVCKIDITKCDIGEIITSQIGEQVTLQKAKNIIKSLLEKELITYREHQLMSVAIENIGNAITSDSTTKDFQRAKILKLMCCELISNNNQ